jgi:oxygen-independent coproporphyrinogen III oxidase
VPLGIYISVPFCRTKCSYCNFASGVFSANAYDAYVARVCSDIARSEASAAAFGGEFDRTVDSIYLGGGTPTVLAPAQLERIFSTLRAEFYVAADAEITVECAPGTLTPEMLDTLLRCGVNRVSLGVQSFVDQESRAVGRLHSREVTISDITRLRRAGVSNLNVDLIAGLPHQTAESWRFSVVEAIAAGVPHASVYMLEVDEDSRLGQELIAGGTRYHAHFVPDDDMTADFYVEACERLDAAAVRQYEISNFARAGFDSRHNLKYWTRQPYLGFGVDAHSMLIAGAGAVRMAWPDSLEAFTSGRESPIVTTVDAHAALEESFFLGLRLNRGIDLDEVAAQFGPEAAGAYEPAIIELTEAGLLERCGSRLRLTMRGRLLSNEVFQRFVDAPAVQPRAM